MSFIAIHGNSPDTVKKIVDAAIIELLVADGEIMTAIYSDHCQRRVLAYMFPALQEPIFRGDDDECRRHELMGLSIRTMLDNLTKFGETINANFWLHELDKFMTRPERYMVVVQPGSPVLTMLNCEVMLMHVRTETMRDYEWSQTPYAVIDCRTLNDLAAPITQLICHTLRLIANGK